MNRLKNILVDEPGFCWEVASDPLLDGWTFNYYCQSYTHADLNLLAMIERQIYRVVATHEDGRVINASSETSFHQAYHAVLTIIFGSNDG